MYNNKLKTFHIFYTKIHLLRKLICIVYEGKATTACRLAKAKLNSTWVGNFA